MATALWRPALSAPKSLPSSALIRRCDASRLPFETTADLVPLDEIIGQDRAVEAIRFGMGIGRSGFNIFAFGPSGHGKLTTILRFLDQEARKRPAPDGWCLVHGFEDHTRPGALRLPPGRATELRDRMHRLVEDLLVDVPATLAGEAFDRGWEEATSRESRRIERMGEALGARAAELGLRLVEAEGSYRIEALDGDGRPLDEAALERLPEHERRRIEAAVETLQAGVEVSLARRQRQVAEALRNVAELEKRLAGEVVTPRIAEVRQAFDGLADVQAYLDAVGEDMVDHVELFHWSNDGEMSLADGVPRSHESARARRRSDTRLRRYDVHVLVDRGMTEGAPVLAEVHPTVANLVGYVDYEERSGVRHADHTLVQPGALHRANGGYLVLEAEALLQQPYAWEALKRALRAGRIRVESPGCDGTPGSVDPEPIALDIKVVLIGEAHPFRELAELDADFPELFKVAAEFSETMPRDDASELAYARFLAGVIHREGLLALDRQAVARVIDESARIAQDAQVLSADFLSVTDLLREADYFARSAGRARVDEADVERAVEARRRREGGPRDLYHEYLRRSLVQVETTGARCGVVNGLVVLSPGEFAVPSRISACVRMGGGEVIDIEREVDLGGAMHSKGVLILSGFLGGRYLTDEHLAMTASLTFEEMDGPVDGDSASVAELMAVLSALAGVPVRQGIAVTGAVSQSGRVHAVGSAAEKIEGFYDACTLFGLRQDQGVVIPAANVQQVMLRGDVLAAVEQGLFRVYGVEHVDEVIELMCDMPAGQRGPDGAFPPGTFNRRVEDRLAELAERRRDRGPGDDEGEAGGAVADGIGRRRPRRRQETWRRGPLER